MLEAGVGRLLVASLHQGIADLLPARLEFYEAWLHPTGLRDGRIGLASVAAVLSFLRREGDAYHLVAGRAGEYTAEWVAADLPALRRGIIRATPRWIRRRLVLRVARGMIRSTYRGSRAIVRWRRGIGLVDIRGSIFCEVRDRAADPLCEFYAAAVRGLLAQFGLDADVGIQECRGMGAGQCLMTVSVRGGRR